jgi:UDP-GlcNAc3NAcA epimerase
MKLISIVGARPQFVKAAVISRAIRQYNAFEKGTIKEIIVHTGQHYDENMSNVFFQELELPEPQYNLKVGSGPHGKMTGIMLEEIEEVLIEEKPDCVLVYGDTNTTLAGALAASKLYLPLAHVEAGLRSYNRKMPEEINRVLTDHASDFLFCPTRTAVDNLKKENIIDGVFLVGDIMYDSFLLYKEMAASKSKILQQLNLTKGSYCLATVHRAENADDPSLLMNIFDAFIELANDGCPFIIPIHPRTRRIIDKLPLNSEVESKIHIIDPLGYLDMICLASNAKVIFTDSGGVQKEAYFERVPCVTLRNETEWEETLSGGCNRLVGKETRTIVEGFRMAHEGFPLKFQDHFGNGFAGEKIVHLVCAELNRTV